MNTAVINIKVDEKLKKNAMEIADELGFSLSSLLNAYLKHFTRTKEVNFSLPQEQPTQYLLDALQESKEDIKAGRVSPGFTNANDAISWLNDKKRTSWK